MKSLKRIVTLLALASVMAFASGCSLFTQAPVKPAEEVVKEAMTNLSKIKSGSYELTMKGVAIGAPEATPKNVDFDGTVAGVFDSTDAKVPKFTMKLDGNLSIDKAAAEVVGVELRLDKDNFYANIAKLPDLGPSIPKEAVAMFMGKWWQIAVPAGTFDQLAELQEEDETKLPADVKAMKDLVKNTKFFKDLKYVSAESVDGTNCFHYTGTLDKDAVKTFVVEAGKIQGQEMAEGDVTSLDSFLKATTAPFDLWVDSATTTLKKVSGKLNIVPEEAGSLVLDISFMVGNMNKAQTVEVPKDATLFDPSVFLGGGVSPERPEPLPIPEE
jgi:hypothetical protein